MNYRKAKLSDNLEEIAELIYQTDKFIYPFWFKEYADYKNILIELIKSDGSLFYYKNILVAEDKDKIFGIINYVTSDTNLNYNYDWLKQINENFKYTIENYIIPVVSHIRENVVYISNVCVNTTIRRHHVGTNMILELKRLYPTQNFELDCLALNDPAVNLYQKQGFEIVEEKKGFNGPRKRKPSVYGMKREHKNNPLG